MERILSKTHVVLSRIALSPCPQDPAHPKNVAMSEIFNPDKEKEFLNGLVQDYTDSSPYSEVKKELIVQKMLAAISGRKGRGLQFGCANGYETDRLALHMGSLDVVDGSSIFIERLQRERQHASNVHFHLALFEEYDHQRTGRTYDYVACNYVLEHVFDTAHILSNIAGMLAADGLVFITVPNAMALSRRLAKEMGLVDSLFDLTPNDHKHGHRRTYTVESLREEVTAAGFRIVQESGIVFKILADFQLNRLLRDGFLTPEHIHGLQRLAEVDGNAHFADSIFMVLGRG